MSQGVEISSEMTLVIDLERYVEARRPSHQHPTSDSTLYQPVGGTITVADYLEVAGKQRAGDLLWDADPPEALLRIPPRRERLHPWSSR